MNEVTWVITEPQFGVVTSREKMTFIIHRSRTKAILFQVPSFFHS
jgi:hypothetical protein